ncbi:MAG TPA: protease pro-enzyme activation domain-containing protein, partial [Terracidiphilus sp.]|nr:protease pro-enzyme activation domain-containing protein [Terracidiphilus sp.]
MRGLSAFCALATALVSFGSASAFAQLSSAPAPSRLIAPIDERVLATLKGNVRRDVSQAPDLGAVEDDMPLHLFLQLERTPRQQTELDNLIARQQQPTAPEFHKWLTPAQFGARFGASLQDIDKLIAWLQSHSFQIRSVLNNASVIDFAATAGQVREAFHTQLHYVAIRGGKYPALVQDPKIPAALAPVVAGIVGLNKVPPMAAHTAPRQAAWDQTNHSWHIVNPTGADATSPAYDTGYFYNVTPQDLYTIYNINPVFTGGNLAADATVAVVEEVDMEYGTVNSTTGAATGGDVANFRTLFGVPGTLNMYVYHGYGSVTCNDPGTDSYAWGEDTEASLDTEWINATAPSARLIFMSCDQSPDNGIWTSMAALVDNNLSDVLSLSYDDSELVYTTSSFSFQDTLFAQAATQGQSILIAAGDGGSDDNDEGTTGTATSGINVNAYGSPLVTMAGGTDFSDFYDAQEGGPALSTYWSSTNSTYYGDALSYIPETAWNASCASSLVAATNDDTGAGYCASDSDYVNGSVTGGGGGISTHYAVPSWQTGTSGYSNSMRSLPDISGFASGGFWRHALIFCDSNPPDTGISACTSSSNFGAEGGTSFVAPYMAGVFGLLVSATGSRQGVLSPALYALAKAQYAAPATQTACYANGQASNTGVTTGLPAATCIFHDITTSNNDVPCQAGSTSCYVGSGKTYGMLSSTGSNSLTVTYPSTIGFDQATGLGSVNASNLISKWNTAFTSSTALSANPTNISSAQSTELQATVTGGTPTGYVDTAPALTGAISFTAGTTVVGTCTLSNGTCSASVPASSLQPGTNSVTATFAGSGTYPSSTSSIQTVTVSSQATLTSPTPGSVLVGPSVTFSWTTVTGATDYGFRLGTTEGSNNLYGTGPIAGTSATPGNLPTNGETIYARLTTYFGATQVYTDYVFTAATQSALTSPTPGSVLAGPSVTFNWTTVTGATDYGFRLGTTEGSNNVYGSGPIAATSVTISNLPTNGETIYAQLTTFYGSIQVYADYVFTAATQ